MIDVRKARPDDFVRVAELLHHSAADMYDRFAGGRERALRVLERSLEVPGNASSAEVVWVAALEGQVAAAMAAFPVDEAEARARAFLRLALRGAPPWRWPVALYLYWAGGRAAPSPPASALYVDALASDPRFRRRGAARALLAEAERGAREHRLPAVALDTTIANEPARRLYASEGFDEVAYRPPGRGLPGFVALVKPLT
ncbi:MAG: GNAT family N-acetyltransferase [Thermoleophilaceae bacterium]